MKQKTDWRRIRGVDRDGKKSAKNILYVQCLFVQALLLRFAFSSIGMLCFVEGIGLDLQP